MKDKWIVLLLAASGLIAGSGCATTPTTVVEDSPAQIAPEMEGRIATLEQMLGELGDADPVSFIDNPHAQRLQDPEAIRGAIEQLKQGVDICTRCLMECGAAN